MPTQELELISALGFAGKVPKGLFANGKDLIYPLGGSVVIKNVKTGKQIFLQGHTGDITCMAISQDGKFLASGQQTHLGFKAKIIIWDLDAAKEDSRTAVLHELTPFHSTKVQGLSFSASSKYLASIGGSDDNNLAIWKVGNGKKRSSAPAMAALCVCFCNNDDYMLVTGGIDHLVRWTLDAETVAMRNVNANMGTISRTVKSVAFSMDDRNCYVGTHTGDLLQVAVDPATPLFRQSCNELFKKGIPSVCCLKTQHGKEYIAVGCGDGTVAFVDTATLKKVGSTTTVGEVTSVSSTGNGLYVGTSQSNIYKVGDVTNAAATTELRASCHYHGINDIKFMAGFDAVFLTCSTNDIRLWDMAKRQELMRIQVPNLTCECIALPEDGSLIVSGWSDGKIRAFKPKSGQLQFTIDDAHMNGVTALSITHDGCTIVSGGEKGEVRFWSMDTRKMLGSIKEHKKRVTSIAIRSDDLECATSSIDGSCLQLDIRHQKRTNAMFGNTMFNQIKYHPDGEYQLLSCGSDCKFEYWDAQDGTAIRLLDGSSQHLECLDIDREGMTFVSGGKESRLKVFSYDEGELLAVGEGHSGSIMSVQISPNQESIVSVGSEGAIFVWKNIASDFRSESKC